VKDARLAVVSLAIVYGDIREKRRQEGASSAEMDELHANIILLMQIRRLATIFGKELNRPNQVIG